MKTEPSVKLIKKERKAPEPQAQAKSAAGPNRWSKAVQSWVLQHEQPRSNQMDWMNPLSGVLQQFTGSAASPARSNVEDDYQPASMDGRTQRKAEALSDAHKLVQEAVDVANKAGIDPSYVLEPHLTEAKTQDLNDLGSENLTWCSVPVIIDNGTTELFEMSKPDDNAEQKPFFVVTQSTANLVQQDFERYEPSLERMAEDWQEAKKPLCSGNTSEK